MMRRVAIKEYLPSEFATRMPNTQIVSIYSGEREEQFQAGLKQTMEEAKRLAKFGSVPGIVQIYDCFEANNTSYIVMEYLEGMSLKEYLETHGKMSAEQAITIALQITTVMSKVHENGILHRDIAPDNIYVLNPEEPENLKVKLLDFGAARYATTKHSKSLSVILKPGYAPEEQYRSHGDQGTWTDVYALAATMYKMLTGVTPEDAMERGVKDELKKPSKAGAAISKATETAIMNALNIKVQDRTQTMEEFASELNAAEVKERTITADKKDLGVVPRWIWGIGAVGVIAAAVTGVLLVTGKIQAHINSGKSELASTMVRVPNVVNREADAAEALLNENELVMARDRMVYSAEIPVNMVSYQEIKENTPVDKDTMVVVWISKGEEKGIVPVVKGLSKEEAKKRFEEAGFKNIRFITSMEAGVYDSVLDVSEEAGSNVSLEAEIVVTVCINRKSEETQEITAIVPDVLYMSVQEAEAEFEKAGLLINWVEDFNEEPEGTIFSQGIEPGSEVNAGSYVVVYISRGPEKIYMKNVQLMSLEEASAEIEALGLKVGRVYEEYSDSVAKGKVIAQSIPQDTEVEKGMEVELAVSLGREPQRQTEAETRSRQTAAQTQAPIYTAPPETAPPETAPPVTEPPTTKPPETEPEQTEDPIWDYINGT